ncbi:unnamed protein product [Caenorhabditis angaria]|uniref:Apple domain-containing protein n=1 Tax=Caenorhabditis angaria TaxID=860376 RepID=A0A9P1J0Z5_9PELO|nr:unnamed protein product [Caenorhabditis angaria]
MIFTAVLGFLMMMKVSAASKQSCLFLPNVMLNGGTVDEFSTKDIKDCCVRCSNSNCCMAYTYDNVNERCYLKNSIGHSTVDEGKTSGLKPNAYFGKGVKLRNIKILGDSPKSISLQNHEECLQYCSVHQVSTWTPKMEPEEDGGDCSCTARIKSLHYVYGCLSEITPPTVTS